jgi:hypothetical protein
MNFLSQVRVFNILSVFLGNKAIAQGLLGSLQLNVSKICSMLGCKSAMSLNMGLRRAVQQRLRCRGYWI